MHTNTPLDEIEIKIVLEKKSEKVVNQGKATTA